jgi:hypothetical protein
MWCKEGLQAAIDLFSRYRKESSLKVDTSESVRLLLSLSLIGLSRFEEALGLFGSVRPAPQDLDTSDSFNYGMAEWGKTDAPPKDMFERVVELYSKSEERHSANYHQCLAIALWVIGSNRDAFDQLKKAKDKIVERSTPEFSCWRYMQVTPLDFQEDCQSIQKLIEGTNLHPLFFPESSRG